MKIETDSHEWVRKNGSIATIGITKKASTELGEIVYVELPKVGQNVIKGDEIAVLESTKAAIDSYAPLSGRVVEVNFLLVDKPELVNSDPEGAGWMYRISLLD